MARPGSFPQVEVPFPKVLVGEPQFHLQKKYYYPIKFHKKEEPREGVLSLSDISSDLRKKENKEGVK